MSTPSPLLRDFPELSHLSREDLEDLLTDPVYFQAVFHSLSFVKELYNSQAELGSANEAIARNNLALQQRLYDLRTETKDAFDEAKALEVRWKEVEKEQKEVYQRFDQNFLLLRLRHSITAQDDASESLASSFVQQVSDAPYTSSSYTSSSSTPNPTAALREETGTPSGTGTPRTGRDVDEFIRNFRELRKVYHKRALWAEKWGRGEVLWRDD